MTEPGAVVIVKTGSAEPNVRARYGDFEAWIASGMGFALPDIAVVEVCAGERLPDPFSVRGIVITGSASFVSEREPWSVATGEWLRPLVDRGETPVLGICYGHQLLAEALGGEVGRNPRGRQIGTVAVDLAPAVGRRDELLGQLPANAIVQATHVESVLALPDGAVRLGANDADENHAFSYGPCAWGVQFHPEFDADVMRGYIDQRAGLLREEGLDPAKLGNEVRDSPHGTAVLQRFGDIVRAAESR